MWTLATALVLRLAETSDVLPLEVRWQAPPACPRPTDVRADIERLAGAPLTTQGASVSFQARVEARAAGLRLEVERTDPSAVVEHTVVESDDCTTLARAFALIVAVDAEPVRLGALASAPAGSLEDAEPQVPLPPAKTSMTSTDVADSDPTPAFTDAEPPLAAADAGPRWRHHGLLGAQAGGSWGATPRATTVVGGWVGYGWGPLRLELSGEYALPTTGPSRDGVAVRSRGSGAAAQLRFAPTVRTLTLSMGAGLAVGRIRGSGTGARVLPRDARDWWLAVPVAVGVAWPADALVALRAQAELSVALRRPAIAVVGPDQQPVASFRRAPATVQIVVGPRLRLP